LLLLDTLSERPIACKRLAAPEPFQYIVQALLIDSFEVIDFVLSFFYFYLFYFKWLIVIVIIITDSKTITYNSRSTSRSISNIILNGCFFFSVGTYYISSYIHYLLITC